MIGPNAVVLGDCLSWLDKVAPGSVDLVYIDPPFCTQKDWGDYDDRWPSDAHYLYWMRQVVAKLHKTLKDTGAILLHCDWRMSHRLRCLLDDEFGEKNFLNEIIWNYVGQNSNTCKTKFAYRHNTIFYYKKKGKPFFQQVFCGDYKKSCYYLRWKSYFEGSKIFADNMPIQDIFFVRRVLKKFIKKNGYRPSGRDCVLNLQGTLYGDCIYVENSKFKNSEPRVYETQKPEKLLKILIESCCPSGGLVLDCFGGSGTTATVAHKLGRQFITGDKSPRSIEVMTARLNSVGAKFVKFT